MTDLTIHGVQSVKSTTKHRLMDANCPEYFLRRIVVTTPTGEVEINLFGESDAALELKDTQ